MWSGESGDSVGVPEDDALANKDNIELAFDGFVKNHLPSFAIAVVSRNPATVQQSDTLLRCVRQS